MRKRLAILELVMLCIIASGCGETTGEESKSDSVLAKQLEYNYVPEVEYTEENKDEIYNNVEELAQAYVGKLNNDNVTMEMSQSAGKWFIELNESYKNSSYKADTEKVFMEDPEYRVSVGISYARDCIMARITYTGGISLLKITIRDDIITDVVEYK